LAEVPIDTKNLLVPAKMKRQKKLLRVQESCQFSLKMKQGEILIKLKEICQESL
jgi:hypothetical protein